MKCKWSLLLGVIAAAACVLPSTAAADIATFGSTLQASHNVSITNQRAAQLSTAASSQLVAPADGLITNWAVRSSDAGAQYELAVIHHSTSGDPFPMVTAIDVAFPPVEDSTDSIRHYNAHSQVLVDQGDSIALATVAGPNALPFHSSGSAGDVYETFGSGVFTPGAEYIGAPPQATGKELLLQATESFCAVPPLRGLKRAIAEQELADHACGSDFTTRKVRARRKRGRVLRQSLPPGTTSPPNTVVNLVVGKKRKHH